MKQQTRAASASATARPIPDRHADADQRPWYAHRWPWLLMLGPVAVILAGIYTTWLAVNFQDALVVDDYYKQGKAINQDLHRQQAAATLGMQARLEYDAAAGVLRGSVTGKSTPDDGLTLRLIHSTQPEKDKLFHLQPDRHGHFSTGLAMLDIARWQVIVENEAREWRLTGTWQWPQDKQVTITTGAAH